MSRGARQRFDVGSRDASSQAAPTVTRPGVPGKPSGPCTQLGRPIEVPPLVEILLGKVFWQESGPHHNLSEK